MNFHQFITVFAERETEAEEEDAKNWTERKIIMGFDCTAPFNEQLHSDLHKTKMHQEQYEKNQ